MAGGLCFRRDFHEHGLEGRCLRPRVDVARHEHVGLRVVHDRVAGADIERAHEPSAQLAHRAANGDALVPGESQALHVGRVDQDHVTPLLSAIDVFLLVHDGIELPFGSHRHQPQLAIAAAAARRAARSPETCALPDDVGKGVRVQAAAGDVKFAARVRSMSAIGSRPGNHLGHQLADPLVALEVAPVHRTVVASTPRAESGQHRDLAPRPFVARRAALAQPHVAEHRFLRRRLRLFVAREHRQDERLPRGAPGVPGVERRGQVGDRVELAEGLAGKRRIRVASEQVAAQAHRRRPCSPWPQASMHAIVSSPFDAGAVRPRRCSSLVSTACLSAGVTPTEPTPCTLLWPRIGIRPACGPSDHPAQEREVGDHLHVLDAVQVVRDAHRPADDGVAGGHVQLGRRGRSCSRGTPTASSTSLQLVAST